MMETLALEFLKAHPFYKGIVPRDVLWAYVIYEENRSPDNYGEDGWNRTMSEAYDQGFKKKLTSESGGSIHPETLGSSFAQFLCERAKREGGP